MDLLGKQGEEASERLDRVENQLGKLESHLNAVDTALQDFVDNYSKILEDEIGFHEEEILRLREVVSQNVGEEKDIERLEGRLNAVEKRLDNHEEKVEQIIGSDLEKTFSDLTNGIKNARATMKDTKSRVKDLEKRLDDLESELLVEINNRDFDFEKKLDKREYEEREDKLEEEVKKLRASVIFLADELDKKDEIEVE